MTKLTLELEDFFLSTEELNEVISILDKIEKTESQKNILEKIKKFKWLFEDTK
jgi:uncharacterized protein YktA (UPF0223 family)